jgi:hypothetical protein
MADLTPEAAVAAAVATAARELAVTPTDVVVTRVEQRQFRDTALDCPLPGELSAQVITPGYVVIIHSAHGALEYHVSARDGSVIHCSEN